MAVVVGMRVSLTLGDWTDSYLDSHIARRCGDPSRDTGARQAGRPTTLLTMSAVYIARESIRSRPGVFRSQRSTAPFIDLGVPASACVRCFLTVFEYR